MHEAEDVARYFLDHIRIGEVGREKGHIAFELGTHGLEAFDLELQQAGALDQNFSCLEAVPAIDCVISEISGQSQAEKQHRRLPRLPTLIM